MISFLDLCMTSALKFVLFMRWCHSKYMKGQNYKVAKNWRNEIEDLWKCSSPGNMLLSKHLGFLSITKMQPSIIYYRRIISNEENMQFNTFRSKQLSEMQISWISSIGYGIIFFPFNSWNEEAHHMQDLESQHDQLASHLHPLHLWHRLSLSFHNLLKSYHQNIWKIANFLFLRNNPLTLSCIKKIC